MYILANNLSTICLCPETFWEGEFKGGGLINLAEEELWWLSTQAIECVLLVAFIQIYNENLKQKAEQENLKPVQSLQKKRKLKVMEKEGVVDKEISTIKEKPSTLHKDNRKYALRASQELTRLYTSAGFKV
jgi:hypothetical protein